MVIKEYCMNIPKNVIEIAKKKCLKSNMKYKLSTISYLGERIIGSGFNRMMYPCKKKQYKGIIAYSQHAESSCIYNTPRHLLKGCSVLIYRHNGLMSKPCDTCFDLLIKCGVKQISWYGRDRSITTIFL